MKISEIFTPDELNEIIENGIKRGIEIAKDEMDIDKIEYNLKNGENINLKNYRQRLQKNNLNSKDKSIINKYKGIK